MEVAYDGEEEVKKLVPQSSCGLAEGCCPSSLTSDGGACGPEGDSDLRFVPRACCLLVLLALQSTSSFVLEYFQLLIQQHPPIIFFLTMLVGAGGNAGCQSAVKVIRQLAIAGARGNGTPPPCGEKGSRTPILRSVIATEVKVGAGLALILSVASLVRCVLFQVRLDECFAICLSMIAIVFVSTSVGATLPLVFQNLGLDPVHAGSAIQVIMDIGGVILTCVVSSLVLGLPLTRSAEGLGEERRIAESTPQMQQPALRGGTVSG